MPFLVAAMFFVNFLDRTAISFAGPNGLTRDLGLTAAQFGFAAGIFFAGYILLEIPSNLALHRVGARRWLARIMVSWGIVSLLFTWVNGISTLYWLRFLLGVAEAGFFPGAIVFLSSWVAGQGTDAHILGLFYIAQPLTIVIGAPVSAALIQMDGVLRPGGLAHHVFRCRNSGHSDRPSYVGSIWRTSRRMHAGSRRASATG